MSNIEWTDRTWNPVRGCTRVSEGCRNCYAERQAIRQSGPGRGYEGLVKSGTKTLRRDFKDGSSEFRTVPTAPRWTGKVRFVEDKLEEPLSWRRPARVFVNSMSDLFHEGVSDAQLEKMFAVMVLARRHTFQVLTKRPERMKHFFVGQHRPTVGVYDAATQMLPAKGDGRDWSQMPGDMPHTRSSGGDWWPAPNVWLGVSVENQKAADERIPLLLQTPAAVRFLSVEPMLGPVDLTRFKVPPGAAQTIDWVIVGGESGPGARPCALEWIKSVVEQCQRAGIAVFVKQLGAAVVSEARADDTLAAGNINRWLWRAGLKNKKGGDMAEWPADLRVREFPEVARG